MNWYKDSLLCLEEASSIILQIEELEKHSIHSEALLERCKPKIKNCLENCRSPLDFVSNYMFNEYCKEHYSKNELNRKRNNYPITYKKDNLHRYLNKEFRNLNTIHHDIVKIIEGTQPFKSNNPWLGHLTSLVNENKHANLSFNKAIKSFNIQNFNIPERNITFNNLTIQNVDIPIGIGDKDYDLINNFPPGTNLKDVDSRNIIIFEELNRPATETLKTIQSNVYKTITSIYKTLQ